MGQAPKPNLGSDGEDGGFGGNNYPLRGMKFTDFDGGTRVAAFASGDRTAPAPHRGLPSALHRLYVGCSGSTSALHRLYSGLHRLWRLYVGL